MNHMQCIYTNCIVQKHLKPKANIANLRTSPSLTQVANHPTVTSACESRMTITGNLSQCNMGVFSVDGCIEFFTGEAAV